MDDHGVWRRDSGIREKEVMKKRISRKVREEAALICAIAASSLEHVPVREAADCLGLAYDLGNSSPGGPALNAWHTAWQAHGRGYGADAGQCAYAEAEALLRCGWSPGDDL